MQMRQLLQNLTANSLKFIRPDTKPVIRIISEFIKRDESDPFSEDTVLIKVQDNGIGFENQYKDQIFTIFQRLHGRLEYEGTGVGLATCRKIVERHRGTIDADGKPGEGATFLINLPVKQAENIEAA